MKTRKWRAIRICCVLLIHFLPGLVSAGQKIQNTSNLPGESSGRVGSAEWSFHLGGLPNGESAGSIQILESELNANSYTPKALLYASFAKEVTIIRDKDNALRQVKAPECLADIITITPEKYELRFYDNRAVGNFTGGLYAVSGSPFSIYTVENPAGFQLGKKLRISQLRDGVRHVSEFSFDAKTCAWSLIQDNLREDIQEIKILANGDQQKTTTIRNPSTGVVSSKSQKTTRKYPWSAEVVQTIDDMDHPETTTTTNEYYEDKASPGNYSKLKCSISTDGSWQRFDYYSDEFTQGEIYRIYRPSEGLPSQPEAATFNNCSVTEYTYAPIFTGRTDSIFNTETASVQEYVLGKTTRYESYLTEYGGLNDQPAMVRTTFSYGSNLEVTGKSEIITYKYEAAQPFSNQIASVSYPDGRWDSYTYEFGFFDAEKQLFTPGNGTNVRKTLTRYPSETAASDPKEISQATTIFSPSGLVLLEQETGSSDRKNGQNSVIMNLYDSRNRLVKVTSGGKTIYSATWVNGRMVSKKDDDGVTGYSYDLLGRVLTEKRAGVLTSYTRNAEGEALQTESTNTTHP